MARATIGRVLGYAVALVAAYAGGIGFVLLFVPQPALTDFVSACKIVSLLALIYANREIPENIDIDRHADIAAVNFAIVLGSMLVLLLMVVKTVVDDYAMLTLAQHGRALLTWFDANAYWVSTAPLFAYGVLDIYIAFWRRGCPRDRAVAVEFVVFRDLVCAGPLLLVLLLTELHVAAAASPDARDAATLFFGGALATILLSSAIATKALNVSQSLRYGRRLEPRDARARLEAAE